MTYWGLLGFFEPGELAVAPGTAFIAPLCYWVYLLFSLVLFVNLLIAMFSNSYDKVTAQAEENWKLRRVFQARRAWVGGAWVEGSKFASCPSLLRR